MYQIENFAAIAKLRSRSDPFARRAAISRTVILLGITSMLTDLSSEMVSTVLPLYLLYSAGLTPLQFGAIDGLYRGSSSFVQVAAGLLSDRSKRHKEVAATGYGLSALCKLALMVVGHGVGAISAVILFDRLGKGIRTSPRDAMISMSTDSKDLGAAFGVHRALDTVGAMAGPLLAFALLHVFNAGYQVVFAVSLALGLIGLAALVLFVDSPKQTSVTEKISIAALAKTILRPRFGAITAVGVIASLATISDAFIYVALQRNMHFSLAFVPLLYVATSLVFMVLAVPFGRLADRFGRVAMFFFGHFCLLGVYTALIWEPRGLVVLGLYLALFGAYYAATDGVLMALGSAQLPHSLRASGLSVLSTGTAGARLGGSLLFGAIWTAWGLHLAVVSFSVALVVGMVLGGALISVTKRTTNDDDRGQQQDPVQSDI